LRDANTGEFLKVGKTSVNSFVYRFNDYLAYAENSTKRSLQVDLFTFSRQEYETSVPVENRVRAILSNEDGEVLPWDNQYQRLKRIGPGVPGEDPYLTPKMGLKYGAGVHWEGEILVDANDNPIGL
jgi:hypothetical protein